MIVVCAIDSRARHHLHQVAQTELEAKIPAHAQDDDFAVEVATFEQLRYRLQLAIDDLSRSARQPN